MESYTLRLQGTQRVVDLAYYLLESAQLDARRYSQWTKEEFEETFIVFGSLLEATIITRSTQAIEVVYRSPNL